MTDNIIISEDGSHTIKSEKFGVTYHSRYGAIQETETVFLNAGLQYQIERGLPSIKILEMGFGTGLNAFMTLLRARNKELHIEYDTIEAYPIGIDQYTKLNYPSLLKATELESEYFYSMHKVASGEQVSLGPNFSFTKHITHLEDYTSSDLYDVIYYDAFAPSAQEHLWTPQMMLKLSKMMSDNACLVTYCAKGSFKRALKSAGLEVEGLPGPIGKREMTRAVKK